ncbi:hypothetical protein RLW55_01245 [Hyphomicrobium sp. B1]|uniref:hypothetical protein n=1 Tax=unclassified Hyphomicrobium TaxID=2619925 RepID=UPI00391A8E52
MPHDDTPLTPVHLHELRELHAALQADEAPPVTWLLSKCFTLQELRHPRQLLRAGKELGNCLSRKGLPLARYWNAVAAEDMRVFEIRHRLKPCALFTVQDHAYREWQFHSFPAGLPTFVDACVEKLNSECGPLFDGITEIILEGDQAFCPWFDDPDPETSDLIGPQKLLRGDL